jgi:hypothetical protein
MKILAAIVLAVVLFFGLLYVLATADNRGKFINTESALIEAHIELQVCGAFTNHFRYEKTYEMYPYTNRFTIDGTSYQCEYAAKRAEFKDRGFLTITTNQIFVWVDKKRGVIPLVRPRIFPPGF